MLVVETVVRIRREHASGKAVKAIARDVRLSRKAIRAQEGAFDYRRKVQPLPRLGPFQERLDTLLTENEARHRRDRLRMTRIHDLLCREWFEGSYDAVRHYARRWTQARRKDPGDGAPAFIPLMFKPGEAGQFDWSHEDVEIAGKPMRVKVAHMRLCASRAVYVRAYPCETQEMVFDAHARGFAFFGGVPLRGIYDNMKTAVTSVFVGKERVFNRRFLGLADHYMVEPTACSPAAGWEKGQVENQVQTIRGRFFQPRLRFASIEELNGWLEAECLRWASLHPHPEQKELTVAEALDLERPALQPMLAPFDGFHETAHAVTGALRNGAPFQGWDLPPALARLRRKLGSGDEADRRFVRVLAAVLTDGLDAIEAAIREALDAGTASDEVILNILARYRDPPSDRPLDVVVDLTLSHPPMADCARYDTMRGLDAAA